MLVSVSAPVFVYLVFEAIEGLRHDDVFWERVPVIDYPDAPVVLPHSGLSVRFC